MYANHKELEVFLSTESVHCMSRNTKAIMPISWNSCAIINIKHCTQKHTRNYILFFLPQGCRGNALFSFIFRCFCTWKEKREVWLWKSWYNITLKCGSILDTDWTSRSKTVLTYNDYLCVPQYVNSLSQVSLCNLYSIFPIAMKTFPAIYGCCHSIL